MSPVVDATCEDPWSCTIPMVPSRIRLAKSAYGAMASAMAILWSVVLKHPSVKNFHTKDITVGLIQPHHCGADSAASLSRLIQPHRLGHSSHGATFCGHSARTVARSGRGKGTSARCLAVSLFTMRNNSCGPGHAFIVRARISRNRALRSMTMICTWLSGGPSPQLPGEVAPWTTLCSKAHKFPT